MKTKWYCRFAEEPEGPFSSRQMRALAKQGRIKAETPVRREADERWYAARKVQGLLKRKKSKRRAAAEAEAAAAKPEKSPAAESEIVRAQLAEPAVAVTPPGVVIPTVSGAPAAPVGLEGLSLSVSPKTRAVPLSLRNQRKAEQKLWIAGGLAAGVVILAVLSGVVAYRLSRGDAVEANGAPAPAAAAKSVPAAAPVSSGDPATPPSGPPASGQSAMGGSFVAGTGDATAAKGGKVHAAIAGQKRWMTLQEMSEGLVTQEMAVQVSEIWWASDAKGTAVKGLSGKAMETAGAPLPEGGKAAASPGGANYLFIKLRLTNIGDAPRKYKSWNSSEKDFAIVADQTNRLLSLVPRAMTPDVARQTEAELKPGQSVSDILVFTAPMVRPESLRVLLDKRAIAETGTGFLGLEIPQNML